MKTTELNYTHKTLQGVMVELICVDGILATVMMKSKICGTTFQDIHINNLIKL